jgi:hypothetical protein
MPWQLLSLLLACALTLSPASSAKQCRSPLNERFETPCATTLATKGRVSVKQLGTEQAVTLIETSDLDTGLELVQALEFGALLILKYFTAAPGGQAPGSAGVVLNRTTPLTIRKDAGGGWALWMAASPSQFPGGPSQLPAPGQYEELQPLPLPGSTGQGRAAYFAVVNFSTPSLPQEADWKEACAVATAPGGLPRKFVLDNSAPFPSATLALYNEAGHQGPWTSECWVGVKPVAQQ